MCILGQLVVRNDLTERVTKFELWQRKSSSRGRCRYKTAVRNSSPLYVTTYTFMLQQDVASHAYSFSWDLNPDWSAAYSPSDEIWAYLDDVVSGIWIISVALFIPISQFYIVVHSS